MVAPEVVTNSIITGYPPPLSKSTVYSPDTKAADYMDFPESGRSWTCYSSFTVLDPGLQCPIAWLTGQQAAPGLHRKKKKKKQKASTSRLHTQPNVSSVDPLKSTHSIRNTCTRSKSVTAIVIELFVVGYPIKIHNFQHINHQ